MLWSLPRGVLVGVSGLAVAALAVGGARLGTDLRVRELTERVPTLEREFAGHLVADEPGAWHAYCRRVGPRPLMQAITAIYRSLNNIPYDAFARERRPLERLYLRVGEELERLYDFPVCATYARRALAASTPHDFALHRLNQRYCDALGDSTITPEERLRHLDRLIAEADSLGDPGQAMSIQTSAAEIELQAGHEDRHRARLARALAEARRLRDDYLACQILGTLSVRHFMANEPESARVCVDEGIALARRHHFPDQASRLGVFAASHFAQEGRLAEAADQLEAAGAFADEFGAGDVRLRLSLEYANFFAELGCWGQVQHLLRTLPPLQREFPSRLEGTEAAKYRFDADHLRARVAFATGRPDEGQRLLAHWASTMPVWNRRMGLAEIFDAWSWGLQASGRDQEALAVCERGLAHSDSAHVPELAGDLALRRVRLLEGMGRLAEARDALDDAERRLGPPRDPPGPYEIALQVARVRLLLHRGDGTRGRRLARETFARIVRAGPTANPDAVLHSQSFQGLSLRDAVHALAGLSPAAGYGFELEWRSLAQRRAVGGKPRALEIARDPLAEARSPGPGMHLVYRFLGRSLLRWTATPGGVVLDTIPLSSERCLTDVQDAVRLLQTETSAPRAGLGSRSLRALERLSRELLPDTLVREAGKWPRVEISTDGPLAALPFEALPVRDPRGSAPLCARVDVAYFRGYRAAFDAPAGRSLILSNPAVSPEVQRRYAWAGPLAGSDADARSARARWPDAIALRGPEATKSAFIERAAGAANIYIAAHHVSDPAAPFLGFVPLAGPRGTSPSGSFLESADLHALDLSACRLAVLASCSSGAPERIAVQPGASLGDAFLDAGAHAVVQSHWDVGDEETSAFMARFLRIDRERGDPVRSLNQARREAMSEGDGVPPRVWAAWSVALTRPFAIAPQALPVAAALASKRAAAPESWPTHFPHRP